MRVLSKKSVAATTAALVLVGGGAAFAYWTTGGSGTGSATAGDVTGALTVNQTSAVTGLYPGGPAATLSGTFDNAGSSAVHVAAVSATVTDTSNPACSAADFVIGGTATVDADIAPGTSVGSWSGLTLSLLNTTSNQDACKGATVTLAYTTS